MKKITEEDIEKAIRESFKEIEDPCKVEHFTDGRTYSYWKIGNVITGDGGILIFNEAMKEYLEKVFKESKKD